MAIIPDETLMEYVGELAPGEKGFLPIDANGAPSGPATKVQTSDPSVYVRAGDPAQGEAPLITESGAPITDDMVPQHAVVYKFEAPAPVLSTLTPNTAVVEAPEFDVLCAGTGFADGAVVSYDGTPVATVFLNESQLSAKVNGVGQTAGEHTISVKNPDTQESAALPFTFTAVQTRQAPPPRGSKTS